MKKFLYILKCCRLFLIEYKNKERYFNPNELSVRALNQMLLHMCIFFLLVCSSNKNKKKYNLNFKGDKRLIMPCVDAIMVILIHKSNGGDSELLLKTHETYFQMARRFIDTECFHSFILGN